jgi:hypothetical protein
MANKDNAGTRRVMKREDFSHTDPIIYIDKDYITALAFTLKDAYSAKYHTALDFIGNCLCGTKQNFNEFHKDHRYDLTYEQVKLAFPDILDMYCDKLQKATGLNKHYVLWVLNVHNKDLFKRDMAIRYEAETGLKACEKIEQFSDIVEQQNTYNQYVATVCNELESHLLDESKWIKQDRQQLLEELKGMISKLRNGSIVKKHHERVLKWCWDRIQTTLP